MLMGEFQHNLDKKGRLIVPAKFREELGDSMVVTRWLDGCLALYTMKQWEQISERLRQLPSTKRETRVFTHMLMSKAAEVECDSQGRILIPAPLLKEAQLENQCMVVGVSDHAEIWAKERWENYYAQASENFEDIAEQLTDFF